MTDPRAAIRAVRLPSRAVVAALALALIILTAGCGGIPSSGPVHAGGQLDAEPNLRLLAEPPQPDGTEEQIVQGFLRAQPDVDDDAVVREYLTGPIAQTWATRPAVVVYPDESSLAITLGSGGAVTVTMPQVAAIDAGGSYAAVPSGTKATLHLRLVREAGQWRIVDVAPVQTRWLTGFDLERAYSSVALYYPAPDSRVLVPDVRWYPATLGLATAIARGQLDLPSPYLRAAVTTAVQSGTSLLVDSVPSTGGLATVALNGVALRAGGSARVAMWAQLAAAVMQAPGVSRVRVTFGTTQVQVPGALDVSGATASELGYTTEPLVTSDPVVYSASSRATALTQLVDNGQPDSLRRPADLPTLPLALQSLAVSASGREYAGLAGGGDELVRIPAGHAPVVVMRGSTMSRPSYDPQGWLWTAVSASEGRTSGAAGSRLRAVLTGPEVPATPVQATTVAAPWLAGRTVTSLRLSRDGARALVVSSGHGGWRIDLAGVVRDSAGRPTALTSPLRLALGLRDVIDATWVDSMTVAVLGRTGTDTSAEPYLIGIGAETMPLPSIADAVAITAGTGEAAIDVVTSTGKIYGRTGSGWVQIASGTGVAFPG